MAERWNEQTAKSFADLANTAKLLSAEGTIDFNFTKAQLVAYLDTLYGALGTALLAANDLSDLDDVPTALTNLGFSSYMQGLKATASLLALQQAIELEKGVDVQAFNAALASLAALGTAADKGVYATAVDTFAEFDLTAAGRAILDDADVAAQRTTLSVDSSAEVDSKIDADVATHTAITTSVHGITDTANLMLKVGSAADNKLVKLNADGTLSNAGDDVYLEVDAQGLRFVPSLSRSNTIVRLGAGAGAANTAGVGWIAVGKDAGLSNTTGNNWAAVGLNAGRSNTTGSSWIAVGLSAGRSNTTGSSWIAVGLSAGFSNTTGSNFTAIGINASYSNTTGSNFTAIGFQAARYVGASGTTPNETCTTFFAVGNGTRLSADGTTNESVMGNDAVGRGSNTLQIGSTAMTEIGLGDIAILVDTPPASSSATGEVGMIAFDADYIYRCSATDTWKRVAIATW